MSRWSAYRWSTHAAALGVAVAVVPCVLLAGPAAAGTSLSVKVSPDRGLVNGQVVTVSGRGLSHASGGTGLTWFVTECTASVHNRVNPATDTPHCDVTDARAVKVGHDGTFSTKFHVRAGVVGDGYCGTAGHTTCVIGISTAKGQGTVVKIGFAIPKSTTTTTTSTATSTSTTRA
jgi:hypothetical protein